MSTTETGRLAEAAAARFLQQQGLKIIEQNWRSRWCEIDIVAVAGRILYIVEVKYRSSGDWGSGFDYVTPRKLRQVQFAAQFWMDSHRGKYDSCRIAAVELTGLPPQVIDWIPDAT